jgi:adenylosuccinate synthase
MCMFVSCTAYLNEQDDISVEYVTLPGWKGQDTDKARTFDDLPKNAQAYVRKVEELMGVRGID